MVTSMRRAFARTAARTARRIGGDVGEVAELGGVWSIPADCDPETAAVIRKVQAYTLTPPARIMALCHAIRHIEHRGLAGAVVECGVWRGGSMMAAALTLLGLGSSWRDIHMFDTFTSMPLPGEFDRHASGADMRELYDKTAKDPIYEIYPVDRVRGFLESTSYPPMRMHFIEGLVEETIPREAPDQIALCRLDTDFYESTAHELEHLYPRIVAGGILIIDDYGEFIGARKAVDEYLARLESPPYLSRIDASCRLAVVE